MGNLVGSMHGVTGGALAAYHHIDPRTITAEVMKSVTLDEAADIGMESYYKAGRFDLLPWCPATASLLDFAWGSGPSQAARSMQRLVRVPADGVIGPVTAKAYDIWLREQEGNDAVWQIKAVREEFYREIAVGSNAKYLQGWLNRAEWASPSNPEFAKAFS
jgi:lysozyme family protein